MPMANKTAPNDQVPDSSNVQNVTRDTSESQSSQQVSSSDADVYLLPEKESEVLENSEEAERSWGLKSPTSLTSPKTPEHKQCQMEVDISSSLASSPFDIEKHKQKLAELKKSPGGPVLKANRRMFVGKTTDGPGGIVAFGGGGDLNNSIHGSNQEAFSDPAYTSEGGDNGRVSAGETEEAFSFLAAFNTKQGVPDAEESASPNILSMFGDVETAGNSDTAFRFNSPGGGEDSTASDKGNFLAMFEKFSGSCETEEAKSPGAFTSGSGNIFAMFGGCSGSAEGDEETTAGYSFGFGNPEPDSPPRALKLF